MLGVRSNVADGAGARTRGIGAPSRLLLSRLLESRGEPTLRILDENLPDGAQRAVLHERARLLHHRIADVRMRQREQDVVLLHETPELLSILERRRQRLVTHDMA